MIKARPQFYGSKMRFLNQNLYVLVLSLFMVFSTSTSVFAYDLPSSEDPGLDKEDLLPLQKISKGISTIAKHAQKAIVFVSVAKIVKGQQFGLMNPFDYFFGPGAGDPMGPPRGGPQHKPNQKQPEYKQEGLGSGFIVDLDKGYILTNNHVIEEADEIHLKFSNGEEVDGKVVGRDKNTDVAVVQVKGKLNKDGLVALSLASASKVDVGDIAVALGAPFGLEASVSMGVVSAIGRGSLSIAELGNFIQTDAAINPGNSGGPLLDVSGQVIGINTAIFSRSGAYNGIGFAIPADLVRLVANQLINTGKVERGYLGVFLGEIAPDLAKELGIPREFKGALIRSVEPKGPADKVGIEAGDVIVKVNGKKVDGSDQLRNEIGLVKPGTTVELQLYRDGKNKTIKVKLGNYSDAIAKAERAQDDDKSDIGITVSNINSTLKKNYRLSGNDGIVVTGVQRGSPAERAGLQEGDRIFKVNNQPVKNTKQFKGLLEKKRRVLLRVERQGQVLIVPMET